MSIAESRLYFYIRLYVAQDIKNLYRDGSSILHIHIDAEVMYIMRIKYTPM